MIFIMGFITGLGFAVGIYSLIKKNKIVGIIQLVLSILTPIFTFLFIQKKSQFIFGGTDWEFLIQTDTIDGMIEPWLILILYLGVILTTIYSIIQIRKINKK